MFFRKGVRKDINKAMEKIKRFSDFTNPNLKFCPICNQHSYIKLPAIRIFKTGFFSEYHVANKYNWKCHNEKCNHISETITEKVK